MNGMNGALGSPSVQWPLSPPEQFEWYAGPFCGRRWYHHYGKATYTNATFALWCAETPRRAAASAGGRACSTIEAWNVCVASVVRVLKPNVLTPEVQSEARIAIVRHALHWEVHGNVGKSLGVPSKTQKLSGSAKEERVQSAVISQ